MISRSRERLERGPAVSPVPVSPGCPVQQPRGATRWQRRLRTAHGGSSRDPAQSAPHLPSVCICPRVSLPAAALFNTTFQLFPLSLSSGLSNRISRKQLPAQSGKGLPEIISSLLFFLIGSAQAVLLLTQACIPIPQAEIKEVPPSLLELCCGSSCPGITITPHAQEYSSIPPRCEYLSAQTLQHRVTFQVFTALQFIS